MRSGEGLCPAGVLVCFAELTAFCALALIVLHADQTRSVASSLGEGEFFVNLNVSLISAIEYCRRYSGLSLWGPLESGRCGAQRKRASRIPSHWCCVGSRHSVAFTIHFIEQEKHAVPVKRF